MAYSGRYEVKNKHKYRGDVNNVIFRSTWELKVLRWLDLNPDVVEFSSEEMIIPYVCKTDGQHHRYFPDFCIKFKNGKQVIVEIKPEYQVSPPVRKKNTKEQQFITEALTYAKNVSKWEAANVYARKHGYIFQVWSERTLESIGIMTSIPKFPKAKHG